MNKAHTVQNDKMATAGAPKHNLLEQDKSAVLLLHNEYGASKSGISSINRQLAGILKKHRPDIPVFCTVLEATEEDKQDAQQDGVILLLPERNRNDHRKASLDWLTFDHSSKYPHIPSRIRSIVGHADITSRAAVSIKKGRYPNADVILFAHDIPEDTEHYKGDEKAMGIGKKEDSILEDAQEADVVFSLGKKIFDHFENQFRAIPASKRPQHFKFVPRPSKPFEDAEAEYKDTETMVVLSIGRVKGVEKLEGLDLAGTALSIVAVKRKVKWRVRGVNQDDFQASNTILEHYKSTNLQVTLLPYGTQKDIYKDMMQADLVLIPSRAEPFGLIGLEAIAAGVPVLVSNKSGLADFVDEHIKELHHSIVAIDESENGITTKRLAESIEIMLKYNRTEFETAARCKKKLLSTKYWEDSHQLFLKACADTGNRRPSGSGCYFSARPWQWQAPPQRIPAQNKPRVSQAPGSQPEYAVLIVGRTGNGKSCLGNSILARYDENKAFRDSLDGSSTTYTCRKESAMVDGYRFYVIDTPGVEHTNGSPTRALAEIERCRELCHNGVDAILLVIQFGQKFTKEEDNVVKKLEWLFGDGLLKYGIVIFTFGDRFDDAMKRGHLNSFKEYLNWLPPNLNGILRKVGKRYVLFDNELRGDAAIPQRRQLIRHICTIMANVGGARYKIPSMDTFANAVCFPAMSTVFINGKYHEKMVGLQLGAKVASISEEEFAPVKLDTVYFFSHAAEDVLAPFVCITTTSGKTLHLSEGHYLYVGKDALKTGALVTAREVKVGDVVHVVDGLDQTPRPEEVTEVKVEIMRGLYCPHTLGGSLVVDGVCVSTYTDMFPPRVAHALLWPIRVLYNTAPEMAAKITQPQGEKGMPTWLGWLHDRYMAWL